MEQIASWVEDALAASSADGCVVVVRERHELNLRFAANALTTNGQMVTRVATVVSVRERGQAGACGSATGPVTSADELRALVAAADAALAEAGEAPDAMPLVDGGADADFADPAVPLEADEFAALARDLGTAFAAAEAEGHLLYGFAELHRTTVWVASTAGTRRRFVEPWGRFELTAKAPDLVNSAWVGQQTNDVTDVDVAAHHTELRRRLAWGERRVELPAGRYETILSPGAVIDMLWPLLGDLSAREAEDGASCFSGATPGTTKVGERLATLPVLVATDPALPGMEVPDVAIVTSPEPGMASLFDTGVPVGRVEWLRDGTLTTLARTRAGQRDAGEDGPLPHVVDNLVVDAGGTTSIDDMIARTERGLLVTCLWYIRTVDPQTALLTGLTRDGVYLVEHGEVVGLVNNFRWNESPLSLLARATEASTSAPALCREWNDWFVRGVAPALRIPDFQMSTVSKAY